MCVCGKSGIQHSGDSFAQLFSGSSLAPVSVCLSIGFVAYGISERAQNTILYFSMFSMSNTLPQPIPHVDSEPYRLQNCAVKCVLGYLSAFTVWCCFPFGYASVRFGFVLGLRMRKGDRKTETFGLFHMLRLLFVFDDFSYLLDLAFLMGYQEHVNALVVLLVWWLARTFRISSWRTRAWRHGNWNILWTKLVRRQWADNRLTRFDAHRTQHPIHF